MDAFKNLGFTDEEIDGIHRMTAASLHLGQVELVDTFDDGKVAKAVTISPTGPMKLVADLLGIKDVNDLITEIVHKEKMDGIDARTPIKVGAVQG